MTFAPAFVDTFTSSVMHMTGVAVSAQVPARVPHYQSVARQAFAVTGLLEGDWVSLSTGAFERLPAVGRAERRSAREVPHRAHATAMGTTTPRPPTQQALEAAADRAVDPLDASTAVPLPDLTPKGMSAAAQSITSCGSATFTQLNVPAGTVLHPPFAATLTDLTPPATGGPAAGEVGIDGIHGHRIEKNARLKLEITDALGQAPTYPVLVQLALGGPQHGQVILDPDGNRIACNTAAFIWHDRDDQGNLIAPNEEFEIGMGTLSSYVGVAPDPVTPGQVIPVWGTAELLNLSAQAKVQIDGTWADPLLMSYNVHPQPGQPDHFLCTDRQGQACPDVFEYWTGYQLDVTAQPPSSLPVVLLNAYFLGDRYGNVVFGPTATSASAPGAGVTVGFADQTSGTTSGDPAGYALTTTWPMRPAPSGQLTSTLSATYPDDPAGDWSGGTVSKAITYQFDSGSTHLLVQAQSYEKRLEDLGQSVVDGPLPMSVAPGATASLTTLADGSTPRLVLLALSGSDVTSLVTGWGQEPSSVPGWGWNAGGGCAEPWCWVQWNPPWDLVVETQATASLRLTLEDGTGRVASEGSFVAHTCPRAEHETDGAATGQGCTDLAIPSTNGTVEVTLNQLGSARGYLGIELTKAPINPGTYVVWVESLDQGYRVRETAQLVGRGPTGEYRGGYAICTVMGGEILDENFQHTDPIPVETPTQAYIRLIDPQEASNTVTLTVDSQKRDGTQISPPTAVTLSRIGTRAVFLAPITLLPASQQPEGALSARTMGAPEGPQFRIDAEITVVADGDGRVKRDGRKAPELEFRWLDEQGKSEVNSPLTTIVRRTDPQTGKTLYLERTMARVVAVDAKKRVVRDSYFYPLRVDEEPNTKFSSQSDLPTTPDWRFSYQGERGVASNLRFDRANPGYLTSIALYKGKTDPFELLSLAGPRHFDGQPIFLATTPKAWDAILSACLALNGIPCHLVPQRPDVLQPVLVNGSANVGQWVDQQTFTRGGSTLNQNTMRDWLEAAAWDVLSNTAASGDPTSATVANDVQVLSQDLDLEIGAIPDDYGMVTSSHNARVTLFAAKLDFDAFRWDTWMGMYYHGFLADSPRALTHLVLHEARHCWQLQTPWTDTDSDRTPDAPEAIDPHSIRLKDDEYAGLSQWQSGNFEVHFNGRSVPEPPCGDPQTDCCLSAAQVERDADYFTAWAAGGAATTLSSGITGFGVGSIDPLQIRAGQTLDDALVVTASQWVGFQDECLNNTRINPTTHSARWEAAAPNLVVEFDFANAPDLSAVPLSDQGTCSPLSSLCVAMTDARGVASVGLTCAAGATAGHYTIGVRIRQLVPSGDRMGDILQEASIPVEVVQ